MLWDAIAGAQGVSVRMAQSDAYAAVDWVDAVGIAAARDVAAELAAMDIDVAFRYPDDGAVHTPGSRY